MTKTVDHPYTGTDAELYDLWLKPNGIIGWMPENARIVINQQAGTVTWPKMRHEHGNDGPFGRDIVVKSDSWTDEQRRTRSLDEDGVVVDWRTTPLIAPVTDRVRELARGRLVLVEQ